MLRKNEFAGLIPHAGAMNLLDVVVAFDEPDALDLGAHLQDIGGALDLQVLDHGDGVAFAQEIAVRVLDYEVVIVGNCRGGARRVARPYLHEGADRDQARDEQCQGARARPLWRVRRWTQCVCSS